MGCRAGRNLRGLLGHRSTINVFADISDAMELAKTTLEATPDLSCHRRCVLLADQRVATSLKHAERVLHVGALGESSSEEGGVKSNQDPRSALEEDSSQKESDPQEDLEARDNRHGHVVVGLNELSNGIGDRVVSGLGATWRSTSSGRSLDWRNSRDDVGTGVGRDVEDGVDAIW